MNRAMHIVMTGEAVSAEKVKNGTSCIRFAELEDLETATRRLVEELAKGPAQSYRVMKEMMWNSFLSGWEEYKNLSENQCSLGLSEDFKEGVRGFHRTSSPKI